MSLAAWHHYVDEGESEELHDGDVAVPSETTVYVAHLESVPADVPIDISDGGAYALLFEKGEEEMTFELFASDGSAVEAAAESHSDEDEHDHDEDEDEHDHEEDEDEDDLNATDSTWGNAIAASLVVSACR